ncbi:MAG: DUF3488 and transglutaminase-like domain-containing protein, partial [Microbacterium sp.]
MSSVDRLAQPSQTRATPGDHRAHDANPSDGGRAPDLTLTAGVYLTILAAVFPLLRVVRPGPWTLGALLLPAVLLAAGYAARRHRVAAVGVSLIETALWAVVVTAVFLGGTAFLGVVPVPQTIEAASGLVRAAMDRIITGAAPLDADVPLTFLLVGAIGLLTIGIDHVVLTARMPLLAAIGLIVVSLIPAIAVRAEVDVPAFVLLAGALLFLLRAETRTRDASGAQRPRRAARDTGVAAAAAGIGAVAVVVALVAAPLLPAMPVAGGIGAGRWNSIDPTLQLGEDLRRPTDGEVLRMRTDAASAPYLRAATLSSFDGDIWRPDTGSAVALGSGEALRDLGVAQDVRVTRYTTSIEVTNLMSGWLPVSYPAVSVTGLQGEWSVLATNRTVLSTTSSANGQRYEVVSDVPRPSLEQIRAAAAHGDPGDDATSLPLGMPAEIGQLADEVTADAQTDYDRLVALQSWFRSSAFRYSLQAPVEDGFDGTGVDAVARFLDLREGYCIHFAGAFALMARTLGMPSRIVVGYLPGTGATDAITRERVYTVMGSQLHAWPEVYFEGIGWVPFEPTNGLGVPTAFSAESSPDVDTGGTEVEPTPTATASSPPTSGADPGSLREGEPTAVDATGSVVRPLPWLASVLVLLVLAVPAAVRELRRRALLGKARAGDAGAAWRSLQDTVVDLGVPEPPGESPRGLGVRLIARHGAPAAETWILIDAIERASYSSGGAVRDGAELADALAAVRAGLMRSAGPGRRMLALLVPRSLVVGPGSAY